MFSILHGLFALIAYSVDGYDKASQNIKNKEMAKKDGQLTYRGARGNEYLVKNNRQVYTKINNNGEKVIVDMKTGQQYHNLSQEKKREECIKCLRQGKTVRWKIDNEVNQTYYGKYCRPYHLIDIESGIPVDSVCINGVRFYIRLSDGVILRPVDNYTLESLVGKWTVEELIDIVNKRQNEVREELYLKDSIFIKNEFFFSLQYVYVDSKKQINIFNGDFKRRSNYIKNDMKLIKKGGSK